MENNNSLLKVISYNIHSGKDILMRPQLDKIINFIRNQEADIIGIQEINENNRRGHQIGNIEKVLKTNSSFAPNVKIGNGYYGVALFTFLRIIETKHILLPSLKEQRGLLHTIVEMGNKKLNILNTHLGLREVERRKQFEVIEIYIETLKDPFILMGDFNTANPDLKFKDIIDTGKIMNRDHLSTFIGLNKRMDYIFISKSLKVLNYQVIPIRYSDHYPIFAEIVF